MLNQDNDSKRSNSSSKNESERSKNSNNNELNSQKEVDLNQVSNRSVNGSDKMNNDSNRVSDHNEVETERMKENYQETNRTDQTLPEKPSWYNSMCGVNSSKKKTTESIEEVDENKQVLIEKLSEYLDSDGLNGCLNGIETKTKNQFTEKYKEYIDRFENSSNKKIDTKEKLGSKILNYFVKILQMHKNDKKSDEIKKSKEYQDIRKAIKSIYDNIYKEADNNSEINFSFNVSIRK